MKKSIKQMLKGVAIFCSIVMLFTLISACNKKSDDTAKKEKETEAAEKEAVEEKESAEKKEVAEKSEASEDKKAVEESDKKEASGEPIIVGVCTAMTGSSPLDGERTKQGVELAVKEINAKGGVLGRPLELMIEDDQNLANVAVNATNKLMNSNIVAQLGPQKSGNTKAVMGIAKENGIPILVGSTNPGLADEGNEYLFRIRASDRLVGQTAAKFAIETLNAKKIGILFNNDDYGMGAKGAIESYLDTAGLEYVAEGHNTGDKDMTGQIMKLKDAGVDTIIVWTHAPECAVVARQLKELLPGIPVVSGPTYTNQDFLNLVDAADIEGAYSVADFSVEKDTPEMKAYVAACDEEYGIVPELFSTTYYQGIYILADAIERAGSTDHDAVRQALSETKDFNGVMSAVNCNAKGEMVHEVTVVVLENKVPVMKEIVKFDVDE